MNVRLAALSTPFVALLAVAVADASPVTLSPLGPAQSRQVAALGTSCAVPYAPAHLAAPFFQYPTIARIMGSEGTATVGVSLSPTGHVVRAWRIQSTGNTILDRAALESAENSNYVAGRAECGAVGGDYQVEVDFSLNQ